MNKRFAFAAPIALAAALTLSACSDTDEADATVSPEVTVEVSAEPTVEVSAEPTVEVSAEPTVEASADAEA